MISCKEASRLASQQLERKLSLSERLQFRLHLAFCIGCRRMERQFRFMHDALGAWMSRDDASTSTSTEKSK
ncbi:MAG: zf-HC2 domain-containing protein [Azonexus sp.]|nr:zf-HC2 domain-containing protein [Azonexus sp.]